MFLAALSFICSSCNFDQWYQTQHVRPVMNEVLNSQCFADELRDRGVAEKWVGAMTTVKRKVPVEYYFENSNVIGYTEPDLNDTVHLNWRFHSSYTVCMSGSNMAHEVLHLEGFRHAYVALNGRQEQLSDFGFAPDAAYLVNSAFESCCPY